jgi:hypothetical protein
MLIALLAILGVDLIVIVAFAVFVPGRRRWLKRQPGEFAGAIRVSRGGLLGEHPGHGGGVKRLGGEPVVIEYASGAARIEVAARAGHRTLVTGPLTMDVT